MKARFYYPIVTDQSFVIITNTTTKLTINTGDLAEKFQCTRNSDTQATCSAPENPNNETCYCNNGSCDKVNITAADNEITICCTGSCTHAAIAQHTTKPGITFLNFGSGNTTEGSGWHFTFAYWFIIIFVVGGIAIALCLYKNHPYMSGLREAQTQLHRNMYSYTEQKPRVGRPSRNVFNKIARTRLKSKRHVV